MDQISALTVSFKDQSRSVLPSPAWAPARRVVEQAVSPEQASTIIAQAQPLEESEITSFERYRRYGGIFAVSCSVLAALGALVGVVCIAGKCSMPTLRATTRSGSNITTAIENDGARGCFVSSFFESSDEDWSLAGDGIQFRYDTDGGYIEGSDAIQGEAWYFSAPQKFHGNFSGDPRELRFCLKQRDEPTPTPPEYFRAVIIKGRRPGELIWTQTSYQPNTVWTCYSLPVMEGQQWKLNDDSTATQADIQHVLEKVTDLLILGEYQFGHDESSLKNVEFDCISS